MKYFVSPFGEIWEITKVEYDFCLDVAVRLGNRVQQRCIHKHAKHEAAFYIPGSFSRVPKLSCFHRQRDAYKYLREVCLPRLTSGNTVRTSKHTTRAQAEALARLQGSPEPEPEFLPWELDTSTHKRALRFA